MCQHSNMWPLGSMGGVLAKEKKIEIDQEKHEVNGVAMTPHYPEEAVNRIADDVARKVDEAMLDNSYHEFERPKNEAAMLQVAGEFLNNVIDRVSLPDSNRTPARRGRELANALISISQTPLRFPARELVAQSATDYVRGYDACSNVTKALIDELIARDEHGRKKYGVNLDRDDLDLAEWLQHQKEELLDGAGYAEAALQTMRRKAKPCG